MPRLRQVLTPHLDVVQQITELLAKIQQCRLDVLGYAKDVGDRLRSVPEGERAAVATAAGITGRSTRFDYVMVAEHWETVQHAGSIRRALKMIRKAKREIPLDLRDVPLPFNDQCVNDKHVGLPIGECAVTSFPH